MPVMIKSCERLQIDNRVTSMSIPLAITCCRSGATIYISAAALFVIHYNNEEMHPTKWVMLGWVSEMNTFLTLN